MPISTPPEPPAGSTQTELEIAQRAQRLIADVAVTEIAKARDLLGRFMVWASGVAFKGLYGEQVVADTDAFLAQRPYASRGWAVSAGECVSCGKGNPRGECPKSKREDFRR